MGWYIYILMWTCAYGGVFIFIHCVARSLNPNPWSSEDALVVVWGIVYALTAVFYAIPGSAVSELLQFPEEISRFIETISSIGIPSLITIYVTSRTWRSKPVAWSIVVGTTLACAISMLTDLNGNIYIAPIVWNFCYIFGCCVQNTKDMKLVPENLCNECGYDLFGLALDTTCPECGYQANRAPCCPTCGQTIPAESQSIQ
tara:strand:- start:133777 stop:134379 length:603 start_codon:yes stop_codon:yes gene_type:complete